MEKKRRRKRKRNTNAKKGRGKTMNAKKGAMIISIVLVMILWMAFPGKAAEFHVTKEQELQTALSSAATNGVDNIIFLAEGKYTGNFSVVTSEDQALTIKSEDGLNPGQVILDGQGLSRVLSIAAGSNNVNFILEDITIQNGRSGDAQGAGVYIKTTGNVSITRCSFTNNSTNNHRDYGYGGGLYVTSANIITLENNYFTHNSAHQGNAVYINQSKTATFNNNNIMNNTEWGSGLRLNEVEAVNITHNNIINNSSGGGVRLHSCGNIEFINNDISSNNGSGIYLNNLQSPRILKFINNRINNNSLAHSGGAVYMEYAGNSTVIFTNNTISGNTATDYGGLRLHDSSITIDFTNNTVTNNSSTNSYGGFHFHTSDNGSINFKDNIISGNMAKNGDHGGGYIYAASSIEFINNIITNNTAASGNRGGLFIYSPGFFNIINNTFSGNSASGYAGGVQIHAASSTDLNFYNNIVWGNQAGGLGDDIYLTGSGTKKAYNNTYHDFEGLWSFAGNNVDIDPFFTNPEKEDFHLRGDSLCLNMGDTNAPDLPDTDRDGNPRIADGAVDLGAYEHSTAEFHPADVSGDWTITTDEFIAYGLAWKSGDLWQQGSSMIPIDYATRAGFLLESGGTYQNNGGGKPGCWVPQP